VGKLGVMAGPAVGRICHVVALLVQHRGCFGEVDAGDRAVRTECLPAPQQIRQRRGDAFPLGGKPRHCLSTRNIAFESSELGPLCGIVGQRERAQQGLGVAAALGVGQLGNDEGRAANRLVRVGGLEHGGEAGAPTVQAQRAPVEQLG